MVTEPAESLVDDIYIRLSMPFIFCSITGDGILYGLGICTGVGGGDRYRRRAIVGY